MLRESWPDRLLLPKQLFCSPETSKLREVTLAFPITSSSFFMLESLINNMRSLRALTCEVRSFPTNLKSLGPNCLEVLRFEQEIFNLALIGHLLSHNQGTLRELELTLGKRDSTVGDFNQVLHSLESLTKHDSYRKLETLTLRVVTMPTFFDIMAEHKPIKLFLKGFRKLPSLRELTLDVPVMPQDDDEESKHYRSYVKSLGKLKTLEKLKIFPFIKLQSQIDHKSKWAPVAKFQRLLLRFIWDKLPLLHTLEVIGDFVLTAAQCVESLALV